MKLGLHAPKKTKTGYSTNVEVLERIAEDHPIVPRILEYRKLTKLKSTYVEGLLKVISPVDGRIHTHFQQTVTATGRVLDRPEPAEYSGPHRAWPRTAPHVCRTGRKSRPD